MRADNLTNSSKFLLDQRKLAPRFASNLYASFLLTVSVAELHGTFRLAQKPMFFSHVVFLQLWIFLQNGVANACATFHKMLGNAGSAPNHPGSTFLTKFIVFWLFHA